jgi:hypothetical protein
LRATTHRDSVNLLDNLNRAYFDEAGLLAIATMWIPLFSETYCGTVEFQYPNAFIITQPRRATCFCQDGRGGADCELGKCPTTNGVICNGRGHASFGQGLMTTTHPPSAQACVPQCIAGLSPCPDGICRLTCNNDLTCSPSQPWRCADSSCQPTPNACGLGTSNGQLDDLNLARDVYLYPTNTTVVLDTPLVFFQLTGIGSMTLPNSTIILSPATGIITRLYTQIDDWVDTNQTVTWVSNPDQFGDVELMPFPNPPPPNTFRLTSPVGVVVMNFIKPVVYLEPFTNVTPPAQVIVNLPRGYYQPFTQNYVSLAVCLADLPQCLWNWNGVSIYQNGITLCSSNCWQLAPINVVIQHFIGRQLTFLNDYQTGIWDLQYPKLQEQFPVMLSGNLTRVELITTGNLTMPCACPSQYGFGISNASVYDAQYAATNYSTPSIWAVVVYRAEGQPINIRSQILAVTQFGATVTAPGYPNLFIPTRDVHYITEAQFNLGLPQADARVFPARCPDGTPSGITSAQQTQLLRCSCSGAQQTYSCLCADEPCYCSNGACNCPTLSNPDFEAALGSEIQSLVNSCQCSYFAREPVSVVSFTASSGVAGTNWTATVSGASWLQANLRRDTRITGVYIGIMSAGIPVIGGTPLPVRLVLEGFDGTAWTRLLTATSTVVNELGRIIANVTAAPYYAVRLSSPYSMRIVNFTLYTDQVCDCDATVVGPTKQQQINQGFVTSQR